jgi:general stress protein 26
MEQPVSDERVSHVWELMESVRLCMLSTWDGCRIHSRPMGAFLRRDESAIYFFTDERAHKDDEIRRFPQVCLAFADPGSQKYVSVSGMARISTDRQKIDEFWSVGAKVWWGSPDNPKLRLLIVHPDSAEYWDAPGTVIGAFKVAFALATGTTLDPGEHQSVTRP